MTAPFRNRRRPAPRVSVVMPVYNAADTIEGAARSILDQTWRDLELIVVDDGSTDGSLGIVRSLAREDGRIAPIAAEHAGLVKALERGVSVARGELIARMDADDQCAPQRLERQIDTLNRTSADVCSCHVALPAGQEPQPGMARYMRWINGLETHAAMERERFIESPLAHPTVVMRCSAFERAGGYRDPGWAEDYDLWLRLFETGAQFVKCPETLFFWRDGPTRATRADSRYSLENFLRCKAHYLIRALLKDRPWRIWGAGRYGKKLFKCLAARGFLPIDFIDIDPRKIGGHVATVAAPGPGDPRILVRGVEALIPPTDGAPQPLILVAVGSKASNRVRNDIRAELNERGFVEGRDYWCVA